MKKIKQVICKTIDIWSSLWLPSMLIGVFLAFLPDLLKNKKGKRTAEKVYKWHRLAHNTIGFIDALRSL